MENFDIYRDIAERTGGDIYIGVVGPVRTGKSTFIKRFMDLLVIPNIENAYSKERARDELPQSAAGSTIMTTEPKFVPNEGVAISLDEGLVNFRVRLIDCVGYLVPGAGGHMEGDAPRMVNTPWDEEKMPFAQAAELGTKKVINEHSTIGVVITTDGTITEIDREAYEEAEARVVAELMAINKPFVMILNSTRPYAVETEELRDALSAKYGVPVLPLNCAQLKADDISQIMEKVLYEFPIKQMRVNLPKWIEPLPADHWVKQSIITTMKEMAQGVNKIRDVKSMVSPALEENEFIKKAFLESVSLGEGAADVEIAVEGGLFYNVLSEATGMDINSDYKLISTIKVLATAKREYDKIAAALDEVRFKGYGIVTPSLNEMTLEQPEVVRHGSRFGVKIKAAAPSLHIIQAQIETEISPIVGSEKESQDLVDYFNAQMEENPENIWEMNMFGKSMHSMVRDGLQNKLYRMPEDAQIKMQDTLQKIINEGNGGLICILL
ncbi:MAG: stage IV sporulation protein A [Defluviitaleaceae bacterium]|nr:stage IV sporulation protein A [Defluviitaleaceae bacterium]